MQGDTQRLLGSENGRLSQPAQASQPVPASQPAQPRRGSGGGGGLSSSMSAIMESQVEEMRAGLLRFKVCASSAAQNGDPSGGGGGTGTGGAAAAAAAKDGVPPHADILVFGPSGSGKSSLIRSFYMALHKTQTVPSDFAERIIVKDTAMNEGTLKYVSAVIKNAKLDHRGNIVSSAIMCHDTRGHIWMDEREQRQLDIMLDGQVKDDSLVQQRNYRYARLLWEFWRRDVDLFPPEIILKRGGIATKPHAVLFVFDGSMEEIPDSEEEAAFYREIMKMLRTKGYQHPQVVLTRIDRVEEQLSKNVPNDGVDPDLRLRQVLDKKIEDVVMRLSVPRTSVHFIENYHSGGGLAAEGRNTSVDFHALKILTQCCNHAETFVSQSLRSAPPRQSQCAVQ